MFKALGFNPEVVQLSNFWIEFAQEKLLLRKMPTTNYYNFGLQDFHKHVTLSHHLLGMAVFICDLKTFENWPAGMQDAVLAKKAPDGTMGQRPLAETEEETVLEKLQANGCQIHAADHEKKAFNDILKPLADPYGKKSALKPQVIGGCQMKVLLIARRSMAYPQDFAPLLNKEAKQALGSRKRFLSRNLQYGRWRRHWSSGRERSLEEAQTKASNLPLVQAGMLHIEYIPLKAYRAFKQAADLLN